MKIWHKLSLRSNLTLLYVGLLVSSVCIVGGYSYWNIKQLLFQSTASHLRAQAKPVIEHWMSYADSLSYQAGIGIDSTASINLTLFAEQLAYDLTSRNTVAVIIDRHGKELAIGKRLAEEPTPPPMPDHSYYSRALRGENEVNYKTKVNGKPTQVLLIPIRPKPGSKQILGVIQLSTPTTSIHQILLSHGIMLMIIAIITLLVGGGLGFRLISSAFENLNEMVDTCQNISEGNFSHRVNYPHQHDEIGKLAHAFNNMVDRIETTFDSQKRFVAKAAHELRTPLTALRGSLEVLLRGSQDDPAAVARLSRGMYKEVLRLIRLCEQLLGLTKLDNSSNIQKQPININDFFEDFIQQANLLVQDRQIFLRKGPNISIMADADILRQILFNLFHNATQHTKRNGTITIGWKLIPDYVEIWVSDDGEGIPTDELDHIFKPFYQGNSDASKRNKGVGLGLSLSKAMIEAHNGHIQVISQPKQGTTFTFYLPLS